MCITRLLFFFFKSHPVRNIEQPVRIPPDGPGSVVPPSSVPRPGQPAHSPGDAAGRTRRTEDRRVGQVRPLGRKSRHTHTHTHTLSGEERWGHSLLKFIPNFFFSSEESRWADRNERSDVKTRSDVCRSVTFPRFYSLVEGWWRRDGV